MKSISEENNLGNEWVSEMLCQPLKSWHSTCPQYYWIHFGSPQSKIIDHRYIGSLFWNFKGMIIIGYLRKRKQTINGQYYATKVLRLKEKIKDKQCGKLRERVLSLLDNHPMHTTLASNCNCWFWFSAYIWGILGRGDKAALLRAYNSGTSQSPL